MSGEFRVADNALQQALLEAEQTSSMSREAMLGALLDSVIKEMLSTQSTDDVISRVEYLSSMQNDDEIVVTRGC